MTRADELDPDHNPKHWIATNLRLFRITYNMTGVEVARLLGITKSQVSNIEAGDANLQMKHAEILDERWNTRGHFARLVRFRDRPHDPDWYHEFTRYEQSADRIEAYSALLVPGLLQTEAYMTALFQVSTAVTDIDRAVRERLDRQRVLCREKPPELRILIKESALLDPVGGPEVMRRQLLLLLEASQWKNVIIRVVARGTGAHLGLDGSFQLLQGPKGNCAYTEAVGGGRLIEDPEKVAEYRLRYDRLNADAQPRAVSERLIREAIESMK
ncbi:MULTISPECIES: helix-turn-helix domain-containing protein [Actinomadura]|uniref:Scr1 family TA system antitoxin-like transcriptional regulator n=1 Tax=Actinomadura yumaensis TaxID=111807 RepID=A0ABW2CF33_9ACTN|nr:helix-turn-helix transcriptional regulator [Actinomadura sp. J1-007]